MRCLLLHLSTMMSRFLRDKTCFEHEIRHNWTHKPLSIDNLMSVCMLEKRTVKKIMSGVEKMSTGTEIEKRRSVALSIDWKFVRNLPRPVSPIRIQQNKIFCGNLLYIKLRSNLLSTWREAPLQWCCVKTVSGWETTLTMGLRNISCICDRDGSTSC